MAQPATADQLEELRPYFAGEASPAGEVDTYCPVHPDENRSAQTNVLKGVFYCNACGAGMTVKRLIEEKDYWVPIDGRRGPSIKNGNGRHNGAVKPEEQVLRKDIHRWHDALMLDEENSGTELNRQKGVSRKMAIRFNLGWDGKRRVYTIPVHSLRGKLWNVRRYSLANQHSDRRKIWGLRGRNAPRLYPTAALTPWDTPIIICEGEFDAILTIQNGFRAITRTGAAHVWKPEWNQYFANRDVFVCHDKDRTGSQGNQRVGKALRPVAASVKQIDLPYPYKTKHGFDLSDFWIDGHEPVEFKELMRDANEY